jgi:hypothetical protein
VRASVRSWRVSFLHHTDNFPANNVERMER